MGIAKIFLKKLNCIYVGNIYAKRDWGHAKEYVETMWKIVNYKKPDDYVISTGKTVSVKEFINISFKVIGINLAWKGKGLKEIGYDKKTKKVLVRISKKYFRPLEVDKLMGNSSKTKKIFKWKPKINLKQLAKEMVLSDIELLKNKN